MEAGWGARGELASPLRSIPRGQFPFRPAWHVQSHERLEVTLTPNVFLSLSGSDDETAKLVWDALPRGLAFFYRESFANGEALLDAMERGVGRAQIFVLLASKESLASKWVGFELSAARIRQISDGLSVYAFPIEDGLSASDFPDWMRDFWVRPGRWGPRDISRFIQDKLVDSHLAATPQSARVIGRGGLLDDATQRLMERVAETGSTPNALFFSGTAQIGRRTFAKYFLRESFNTLPNLATGPELRLPQFADIADMYRALRENIDTDLNARDFSESLETFKDLNVEDQVEEVVTSLSYFSSLGQAVFIGTGSGLFDELGTPKAWIDPLLRALADRSDLMCCFISNRKFREEYLMQFENALQIPIPALSNRDTQALITLTSSIYAIDPVRLSDGIVRAIGGHPAVAKAAVRLVAQKGIQTFEKNPTPLFSVQDGILSQNLDIDSLSVVQKEILSVLSWVPLLSGSLLLELTAKRHENAEDEFVGAIEDLIISCLIVVHGDQYAISSEIREIFRRKYGYGDGQLVSDFSDVLEEEWNKSSDSGGFRTDLFDAFVYMHALAGKALPQELRRLLLPGTLEEVLRRTYAQGRDDRQLLEKVVEWGAVADEMKMDDTVREAILTIVIQAEIRLRRYSSAGQRLKDFAGKGYRSAPFLRGFMLRREGKLQEAIPHLREAIASRKNLKYSVQELATVYQRLGKNDELAELVRIHEDLIEESAVLLDFRVAMLISSRRFPEAEAAITRLSMLPQDEGRSTIRTAQIMSLRDGLHSEALRHLNELFRSSVGDAINVRRWRGLIAAYAGDFETAKRDIEFLASRNGQERAAQRLRVHVAIAEQDAQLARDEFDKLGEQTAQDRMLKAKILEMQIDDPSVPLATRNKFRSEAAAIRNSSRGASEFDF